MINKNIEEQIRNNEDILKGKYKELDNILNNISNKNEDYIEYLNNDIEKIEGEIKKLKKLIKIKYDNIDITKKDKTSENDINNNLEKDLKNDDNKYKSLSIYENKNINNHDNTKIKENCDEDININNENNSDPNIKIFVNGFEYNDKFNMLNINENINNNKVKELINKLQYDFLELSRKIKTNIDETIIKDKYIYGINLKLELNKIISEIDLFKNNYQDIINRDK